ncbi:MAG: dihydroorotate dehydrogenase [Defluviitaleaceae bacterium]|nr:dihydroorotate dehydrogenase [Defluviitaleaceae bacterium]
MDLTVNIAGVIWKNPVTTASGTVNSGKEYAEYVDFSRIGALTTKGVAASPWAGNPTPRVAETYGGMLNAIGLQNPGIDAFIDNDLPYLRALSTNVIVNVCGRDAAEFAEVSRRLEEASGVDMLEINVSCPNVKTGGVAFAQDPKATEEIITAVKRATKLPIIAKLSPNVTSITEIAKAAESAGANALSMVNTLLAMKIDIHTKKPILANTLGGLSGPAIKPVAVRCVYQAHKAVKIPIIGMGGIMTGDDAIEFMLAGASAVAIGTAHFTNPKATLDVLDGIKIYMEKYGVKNITELIGGAH